MDGLEVIASEEKNKIIIIQRYGCKNGLGNFWLRSPNYNNSNNDGNMNNNYCNNSNIGARPDLPYDQMN